MKRKILSIIFTLVICLSITAPVFAASDITVTTPGEIDPGNAELVRSPRLIDDADVLTDGDKERLIKLLDEISERQKFDVAVITVSSLDGMEALEYAENAFINYGYGFGENKDGVLFMVSPELRDWALSPSGFGLEAFTYAGQDFIVAKVLNYLSDDFYYEAFVEFAKQSDAFVTQARNGEPFDGDNMPKDPGFVEIGVPIILGILLALVIVTAMKGKLKSVRMQDRADDYERPGSMVITAQSDNFLYSNVVATPKPKNDSSSGGSSGSSGGGGGSSGKY